MSAILPLPPAWKKGKLTYGTGVPLASAKKMLEAAEKEAEKQGAPMSIAILDSGGNLLAFCRMDDAMLATINIAIDKAFTAVFGKLPSESWRTRYLKAGLTPPSFVHERFIPLGGGFPMIEDGAIRGGVGVSGGTGLMDTYVARAALSAGGFSLEDIEAILTETEALQKKQGG